MDFEAEFEQISERTIAQQRYKLKTYDALVAEGLPVPQGLREEVESASSRPMQSVQSLDPLTEDEQDIILDVWNAFANRCSWDQADFEEAECVFNKLRNCEVYIAS